ncbi:hypothetical protein MKK75_13275 [Methylobacterium sp. J-030]|uniref:hypothetical protein n=1 Tax=Methylobacterium sp. J-030 TaxID=2836627 RepID=UPI001FB869C6|nr:hypothetical protein [Methylobacterium sp. J-030]MCJ2069749.1 hypothetical protein [Methylobacterium sp. J-030]
MPAGPSTLADLRKAGIITSQEIVAAIDGYLRDPAAGPYRFASGHSIDIAALVALKLSREEIRDRAGPQEKTFRTAVAAVVMAAHPTLP